MSKLGSFPTDWDVEQYRHPWDSDDQWDLRRQFICAQKDLGMHSEDMIVCWAQVYANVEILGCSYPDEVMAQVKQLSEGIESEYSKRREDRQKVAFVKATEKEESNERKRDGDSSNPPAKHARWERPAESNQPSNRSAASSYFQAQPQHTGYATANKYVTQSYYTGGGGQGPRTVDSVVPEVVGGGGNQSQGKKNEASSDVPPKVVPDVQLSELRVKVAALANILRTTADSTETASDAFQRCLKKLNLSCVKTFTEQLTRGSWKYNMKLEGVYLAGAHGKKNKAPVDPVDAAVALLRSEDGVEVFNDPLRGFVLRRSAAVITAGPTAFAGRDSILEDFVLVQHRNQSDSFTAKPLRAIHLAARFNQMKVEFGISDTEGVTRCVILLDGVAVGDGEGDSKQTAKDAAAVAAIRHMRKMCQTLLIDNDVSDDTGLSKYEVGLQGHKYSALADDAAIPDDNVGNKLLRMMGWSGGGLGKDGNKGILEPIKAVQTFKRQGLGLNKEMGVTPKFTAEIHRIFKDFVASQSTDDMVFSSEFSKEERAEMHGIAQTYELKTQSYGKGRNRHLTISKKTVTNLLLQFIRDKGGETGKYKLLPPGHQDLQFSRKL